MKDGLKRIISGLAIPELGRISPYRPGKPIDELKRDLGIRNITKMASNENPFGPSPLALKALKSSLKKIYLYPDGNCFELKKKLSERSGLKPENFIIGNGSNEIIELVVRAFIRSGDEVIIGDPSFVVYKTTTTLTGGKVISVPLKGFLYDIDKMLKTITDRTKLIIIGNPNNPTGTIVASRDIRRLLNSLPEKSICIFDEAYREFVTNRDYPGELEFMDRLKPVLIMRTFSKAYGLAGLRIGYGISDESLIDCLNRIRQPFNVNHLAQIAASAALDDKKHLRKTIKNNNAGMKFIKDSASKLGLNTIDSQANFILIELPCDGEIAFKELLKRGIIVRSMGEYSLKNYIRLTIGLPAENRRFVKELKDILKGLN